MNLKNVLRACIVAILFTLNLQLSAQNTAFSYQGHLNGNGNPVNGLYDFQFALFDAVTNGNPLAPVATNLAVTVNNGVFSTTIDFGNVFNGSNCWLAIAVSTNGAGDYMVLSPRQVVNPVPYATFAPTAGSANVANSVAAQNISGAIALAQLPTSLLTNGASGVNLSGAFSGNGAGVTNLSAYALAGTTISNVVVAWGGNGNGSVQANVPANLNNVVAVAAGPGHSLALKSDGTVVSWGDNEYGQRNIPTGFGNAMAVAAGETFSLVLERDGTVVAWGSDAQGETDIPAGLHNVVAIAAGEFHSLALKNDGTVVGWGNDGEGETDIPAGLSNVVAIAAGAYHSLAVKSDGTVVAWGYDADGETDVPAGLNNVVAVSGGSSHSLALKSDGTVVGWGSNNYYGQTTIPAGLTKVIAIVAGDLHSLALKSDGTIVAWGGNSTYDRVAVPTGLNHIINAIALAPGCVADYVIAIKQNVVSPIALQNWDNTLNGNLIVKGTLAGDGSALTNLNASQIASGLLSASQVPNLDAGKITSGTLSAARLPAVAVTNTEAGVTLSGIFTGDGGGLTNVSANVWQLIGILDPSQLPGLDASKIATGTLDAARLPAVVVTNLEKGVALNGTFSGAFNGNGAGVTNVNLVASDTAGAIGWITNYTPNFTLAGTVQASWMGFQSPSSLALADFNGDGKVDLIVADPAEALVEVFTNDGAGGFVDIGVAGNTGISDPESLIAVDVNGDGKMDLACADDGYLLIMTNNGNATFTFTLRNDYRVSYDIYTGIDVAVITTADVNGDGKVDFIATDIVNNRLAIMTNNGDGTFDAANTPGDITVAAYYATGHRPSSLLAVDINGDGKPDLITGNFDDNTVYVMLNNGHGNFITKGTYAVGTHPDALAVADVNGDGKPDLICANRDDNTLMVLTNDGTGGFVTSAVYSVGTWPTSVVAADFNHDGKVDLASAGFGTGPYSNSTLTILTNNGVGGFAISSQLVVGRNSMALATGDLNGDGWLDLLSLNYGDLNMAVLTNQASINNYTSLFNGNGAGLTGLNAAQITGTLSSSQVPSLDASKITSGILNASALPATVVTNLASGVTLSGTFNGNGASLTNLDAGKMTSGTLSAARLPLGLGGASNNTSSPAVVAGGSQNTNTGAYAAIGGGRLNLATNLYATIPGGTNNIAGGQSSFAAGNQARALHNGAFVWADNAGVALVSTNDNSVTFRASGGYRLFTGTNPVGVFLSSNSTAWATISDKNTKKDFQPVNPESVLDKLAAVPVEQWHYKWETGDATLNLGPMAQDFKAAFYPGRDDKSITTLEFDGVELAAIQGLNQRLQEQAKTKDAQIESLQKQVTELQAAVRQLQEKK